MIIVCAGLIASLLRPLPVPLPAARASEHSLTV